MSKIVRLCLSLLILPLTHAPSLVVAQPEFVAPDNRLPSPYRPFVMDGPPITYGPQAQVTVYDLRVQAVNPADVEFPITGIDSEILDSSFSISYELLWGVGLAPPVLSTGQGSMHVTGGNIFVGLPFVAEVVELNLPGISLIPEAAFRESPPTGDPVMDPLRESRGIITSEAHPGGLRRISAYFDVHSEITLNGGTWMEASSPIHLVQVPEPATWALATLVMGAALAAGRRRR